MKQIITPKRTAHLYALMAWNDSYSVEDAKEIAYTTPYKDLDNITYAETSIIAAIDGIKKYLLTNKKIQIDKQTGKIQPSQAVYDTVIKIITKIHDKWVVENAKKYDRGNPVKSDKNLFQHLPTALIGIDEVAKDLMFLAPIMEKMGVSIGEMELSAYGAFKPNEQVVEAYNKYVTRYNQKHGIKTKEDLDKHIDDCISGGYDSLKPTNEKGEERISYMQDRIPLLRNAVINKNDHVFGGLPDFNTEV